MNSKGQGSIEYLLLVGGAILISALAVVLISSGALSGKSGFQNAQNVYSASAAGLQTIGGLTIYGSETVTEPDNPPNCFRAVDSAPTKFQNGTYSGFQYATCEGNQPACFMLCTASSEGFNVPTIKFNVPTKNNTHYNVQFKIADYMANCNSNNVLRLAFLVNGTEVPVNGVPFGTIWTGNSAGGISYGGWAYPSINFTAEGPSTLIEVRNYFDYSIPSPDGYCYSDLNLTLNWLKIKAV